MMLRQVHMLAGPDTQFGKSPGLSVEHYLKLLQVQQLQLAMGAWLCRAHPLPGSDSLLAQCSCIYNTCSMLQSRQDSKILP